MTRPLDRTVDADAAVSAYEELRRHVLAASPRAGALGWIWLVREGLATWIERCTAGRAPVGPVAATHDIARSPVLPPLHVGLVHALTTIALSRRAEALRP